MTTQTITRAIAYKLDQAHSSVEFAVRHLMFSTVRGRFSTANADIAYDRADPANSSVEVQIDVRSVDTNEPTRDQHLRTSDFFDAENHPLITFRSTRVSPRGGGRLEITGDLTIRGVTRQVVLDAEITGEGPDAEGGHRIGFAARTAISRREYGVSWNQALETGGVLVGDEVKISIEGEAVRQG